jgi:6-phosphogluconolactonase
VLNGFPLGLAVHHSGKFLYASVGNSIVAWNVNTSTGALSVVSGSPFPNRGTPILRMVIDPTGKFLYQLNQDGSISGFVVDASSGGLTAISGSPFASGSGSVDLVIDPSGLFLYAASISAITGFNIDSKTGTLTVFRGPPFPASDPNLMTIVKIP